MAPPLTIRNLTSTPLNVRQLERYPAPSGAIHSLNRFTGNITSFTNNVTETEIPDNAEPYAREDVDIRVEPFAVVNTDKAASERADDILRVTIELEGQRYRIDVPLPVAYTRTFTPLVPDPRFELTAVYVKDDTFLTVYSSRDLASWMQHLRDPTPLSALSIPGTHNSPTCHKALPSVRCQAVSPRAQLDNGVRFFDIRVQPERPEDSGHDGLILVHGVFPISLTGNKYFRDLVNETVSWLEGHGSETVIFSVKREGPGEHNDAQLARILRQHYANNDRWWTEPRIPRLGEARGKIVLMRRFALADELRGEHDGRGWALDAENWAYNTPNDRHGEVVVQDFCEVLDTENIDAKLRYATEHLERAGCEACGDENAPAPPLYLNFLSASNFWKVGCWPEKIAAILNPAVTKHLATKHVQSGQGDWGTGVVICDWVGESGDWDLVRCIVGMNSKLMVRQGQ
ncbi:PLC-like phosphodiesterase [Trichodelitschia bisporula]|uniref:PLC-like phosphodiesterase n=1 Tax=Trichodelitschia bisporula TaxID=703511 RepID=A0A6G1HZ61_9PEZI|nr:PLC-like phosphodiesterase [Trichodelitschia bisporula]